MGNKGFSLIFVIFLIVIITIMGSIIVQTVLNTYKSAGLKADTIKAFYLAEAAIEYGKAKINSNPAWYTDTPLSGEIIKWLRSSAKGESIIAGAKSVKAINSLALYGVGHYNKAYVIIKFEDGIFEEL